MKRTTWIFLILFLLAVGMYYLLKFLPDKTVPETTPTPEEFSYPLREMDSTITSIDITNRGLRLQMERNSDAIWEILFPERIPADQTKLSEAESQLTSLSVVKVLEPGTSLEDYGLSNPTSWISVTYANGLEHLLRIGSLTPTNSGYYVLLENSKVGIISQYSLDPILGLADAPPYPPTLTPTATSEQPTFTLTIENTPTPSLPTESKP